MVTPAVIYDPVPIEDSPEGLQTSLSSTTIMNAPVLVETVSSDLTLRSTGDHGTCSIADESIIMYTPNPGYAGFDEVSTTIHMMLHLVVSH